LHNTGTQNAFTSNTGTAGMDLNLLGTWANGYLGQGVNILVSDTGVQSTHEDLAGNFLTGSVCKDFINGSSASEYSYPTADPTLNSDPSNAHGTAVAGIITAVSGNGVGSTGVAPKAKLASANWVVSDQTTDMLLTQVSGNFNIFNQSWGTPECSISPPNSSYVSKLQTERKIYIKAAGNSYNQNLSECGRSDIERHANANFDPYNTNPYTIVVAALNAKGVASSYSTPGSNIWISGFGGEYGWDSSTWVVTPASPTTYDPALITTDLMDCTYGESPLINRNPFQDGTHALNRSCNYTSVMNGTSAATPTISGAVALLLSANPALTARDVKHILAMTATQNDPGTGNVTNAWVTSPTNHIWGKKWVTNTALHAFNNRYGFGMVNTDAAVAMATSGYIPLPSEMQTAYISSGTINVAIPDATATNAGAVSKTINVPSSYVIEAVQVVPDITHADIGQLGIELTSPSGTTSILMNINNSLRELADLNSGEVFLSNAFYGENSSGNWTIKVLDGKTGTTGQLKSWQIKIIGH
jgi:subtilisin-like proprotein convertase family protein